MKLRYPAEAFALGIILFSAGMKEAFAAGILVDLDCSLCRIFERSSGKCSTDMESHTLCLDCFRCFLCLRMSDRFCLSWSFTVCRHMADELDRRTFMCPACTVRQYRK